MQYSNFAVHFGNANWNRTPFTFVKKKPSKYLELLLIFNEKESSILKAPCLLQPQMSGAASSWLLS